MVILTVTTSNGLTETFEGIELNTAYKIIRYIMDLRDNVSYRCRIDIIR